MPSLHLILAKMLHSFSHDLTEEVKKSAPDLTAEGGRFRI